MDLSPFPNQQENGISETLTDQITVNDVMNDNNSLSIDAILTEIFKKTMSMSIPRTHLIDERNSIVETIKNNLLSNSASYGLTSEIECCSINQVKSASFSLYSKAMQEKRNGNANVRFCWFIGSKNELKDVLSDGFCHPSVNVGYGFGTCLWRFNIGAEMLKYASADENGYKNMLLCCVIVGHPEVVRHRSTQYKPSSDLFDTGIDRIWLPKKYIVWNGNVNTHILPEFIFSLKAPFLNHTRGPPRVPKSNRKLVNGFIKDLSKFLPADAIALISKHFKERKKHKITKAEFVGRMREIAGDELLRRTAKAFWKKNKKQKKIHTQNDLTLSELINELMSQFPAQLRL